MEDKKIPRKLRNGKDGYVFDQVIRWRQKMKRKGLLLGKHMRKAKEQAEGAKKYREITPEKLKRKRDWFG